MKNLWKCIFLLLLVSTADIVGKRGGGGGFGRGGGFGSRGSSAARASSSKGSGGGWFGGGGSSAGKPAGTHYTGGGHSQPNYGGRTGTGGGGGGLFGSGKSGGGYGGGYRNSAFTSSGIGSRSRSDTFKNMIVGAAAGYLIYQGGKHIIRSMSSPMMWNNRQYYWGQQYYPGGGYASGRTMCRMPLEGDSQFGSVYTAEGGRPKEIVWSCGMNERCCGYECCPGGYGDGGYGYGGGSRWNSSPGIGLGTILLLLLLCGCGVFIIKKVYDRKCENDLRQAANKAGYESAKKYSPMSMLVFSTLLLLFAGFQAIQCGIQSEIDAALSAVRDFDNRSSNAFCPYSYYRILDGDYPDWSVNGFRQFTKTTKYRYCEHNLRIFQTDLKDEEYRVKMLAFLNRQINQLDGRQSTTSHWMILAIVFMVIAALFCIAFVAGLVMLINARRAGAHELHGR